MKSLLRFRAVEGFGVVAYFLLLTVPCPGFAQTSGGTNYFLPVVTIRATDPVASVSGDTGTFTVFREGSTDATLNVYYRIAGAASNGVDYAQISNWVNIPAGVRSNSITIAPINHGQTNLLETVVLQLAPSPLLIPVNYVIGYPSNAVVFIEGSGVTNLPPAVRIATPTNGATFFSGVVCPPCATNIPPCEVPCYFAEADITICADARDPDGYVATVEFFADTNSLGIRTNCVPCASPINPFCLLWTNAPPGNYVLTALATDNQGVSTISDPVNITVLAAPPPATNLPPVVRIISPPDGAIFRAPVDIPIFAYARDFDGSVSTVEFLAGTNSLAFGNQIICPGYPIACADCPIPVCPTNLYFLVWSNAPLGTYVLTAVATDNGGASTVSDPVNVTILPSPPPPTNRPPIVSIVATDPVAIEGTNCWVWPGVTNSPPSWTNWSFGICRSFTNCGPKNAIFTVRRYGATNNDLTVLYAIGGTATNGVEYVTLPGAVTIPAGERRALITLVPIDDGPPDITSTVILKLTPSTNLPSDYLVGFPPRAAAIIIDGNWPRPLSGMLPDECFHLRGAGPDGAWFRIEYSTNMLNWLPVCTNQVIEGSIDFVDPDTQGDRTRFYRAVPEANPPSD